MIKVARNIRRKNFEMTAEGTKVNRGGRDLTRERLREIEDRLLKLEKKTGIIKE